MNRFFSIKTSNFLAGLLLSLLITLNRAPVRPAPLATPLVFRWSFVSDSLPEIAPTSDVENIYIPLLPSIVISLGGNDGLLRWKADIGGEISGPLLLDTQRVYIISEAGTLGGGNSKGFGIVRAVSKTSGVTLWVKEFTRPLRHGLTANPVSLFVSLDDGRFYSIDKLTGETRWTLQFPYPLAATPVLDGVKLYALTTDGNIITLDQRTGNILERYRTGGSVRLQPSIRQGILYFGTEEGYVIALSARGDSLSLLWRKRVGVGLQNIVATSEGVLVTGQNNFVLFLDSKRGRRLWKRQMPARLAAPPAMAQEAALFAPIGEETCVALSLRNGKVINYLPLGKDNSVVALPLIVGEWVFIPTRRGLLAFAPAGNSPKATPSERPATART
jgi:outer membrane protein assembly factor BamB